MNFLFSFSNKEIIQLKLEKDALNKIKFTNDLGLVAALDV
jgi:hypothetical protein